MNPASCSSNIRIGNAASRCGRIARQFLTDDIAVLPHKKAVLTAKNTRKKTSMSMESEIHERRRHFREQIAAKAKLAENLKTAERAAKEAARLEREREQERERQKYVPGRTPTIPDIQRAACEAFRISKCDFNSRRKTSECVNARAVAFLLCRILTKNSFPRIGRLCGGFDHATVLYAVRKLEPIRERINTKQPIDDMALQAKTLWYRDIEALKAHARAARRAWNHA